VLDDNSSDETPSILRDYENRYDRIRIIEGRDRPDGWKGKTFAVSWAASRLEERELDAFSAMAR